MWAAREIVITRKLNHGNVIKLHQVCNMEGRQPGQSSPHLVMEYCPADLGKVIYTQSMKLSVDQTKQLLLEISMGLEYIHDHLKILHRDLKPSDILLTAEGE